MIGEIPEDIFFISPNHNGYMNFPPSGYCGKPLFGRLYHFGKLYKTGRGTLKWA